MSHRFSAPRLPTVNHGIDVAGFLGVPIEPSSMTELHPNHVETRQPNINPYLRLWSGQLDLIAQERDLDIGVGPVEVRAAQLYQIDEILGFEWLNEIRNIPVADLERRSLVEVIVYAALNGIEMSKVMERSTTKVAKLVKALLNSVRTWRGTAPPPKVITRPTMGTLVNPSLQDILSACRSGIVLPIQQSLGARSRAASLKIDPKNLGAWIEDNTRYPIEIGYPEFIDLLTFSEATLKEAFRHLVPRHDRAMILCDMLDWSDLVFALAHGYLSPSIMDKYGVIVSRHETIRKLPTAIKNILYGLYSASNDVQVAKATPHKLEPFIMLATEEHHSQVIQMLGIVVPITRVDALAYLRDNIIQYRDVATRSPNLKMQDRLSITLHFAKCLTDYELLAVMSAYWVYNSREQLLLRFERLKQTPGWFVPLKQRWCQNEETTLLTETSDMTTFMVAFGTFALHHCYELGELAAGFHRRDNHHEDEQGNEVAVADGDFVFTNPQGAAFNREEVMALRELVTQYRGQEDAQTLLDRIDQGLASLIEKTQYDQGLVNMHRQLTTDDKTKIDQWLEQLFFTGMYLRRWQGPGHPYPIRHKETKTNIAPEVLSTPAIYRLTEIRNSLSSRGQAFVNDLRVVAFLTDSIVQDRNSIGAMIRQVNNGTYCIRMASSRYVGTGFYYRRLLYHKAVANFDPRQVEHII